MTIKEALNYSGVSTLEAEVLLCYLLKKDRAWLYSHQDDILARDRARRYHKLIARRQKGEPIAYITGHKEFFGLDFYVDQNVLIPRPETELLVEKTIQVLKSYKLQAKKLNILDLGTGSGNIIISIRVNSKQITVNRNNYYATDISKEALKVAKKNAKKHKVFSKIQFIHSDLFDNLYEIKFDLIIANLPYLDKKWIDKELKSEPKNAFDGGKNGLEIIEKFLQKTNCYLAKNGIILIEIDPRQRNKIKKLAKKYFPNKKLTIKKDLSKFDRIVILS